MRDHARERAGHRRARRCSRAEHRPPGVRQGVPSTSTSSTVRVPVGADGRADAAAMRGRHRRPHRAWSSARRPATRTASSTRSPSWPALAAERGILCHVDACLGGWLLPWWERLGEPVPPWDFRVAGRDVDVGRHPQVRLHVQGRVDGAVPRPGTCSQHQFFLYDDWPGGLYGSATTAGTRPAAPIAGGLGGDQPPRRGRLPAPGRRCCATPPGASAPASRPSTACTSPTSPTCRCSSSRADDGLDIGAVGDVMDDRGWNLDRQQGGLHLMLCAVPRQHRRRVPRRPARRGRRRTARAGAWPRATAASPERDRPRLRRRGALRWAPAVGMGRDKALLEVDGMPMAAAGRRRAGRRPAPPTVRRVGGDGRRPRGRRASTTSRTAGRARGRSAGVRHRARCSRRRGRRGRRVACDLLRPDPDP